MINQRKIKNQAKNIFNEWQLKALSYLGNKNFKIKNTKAGYIQYIMVPLILILIAKQKY